MACGEKSSSAKTMAWRHVPPTCTVALTPRRAWATATSGSARTCCNSSASTRVSVSVAETGWLAR